MSHLVPTVPPSIEPSFTVPSTSVSWIFVSAADGVAVRGCLSATDESSPGAVVDRRDAGVDGAVLVGRVYHTAASYVFEESPFTLIPGSVVGESLISIPWGLSEYKYDSFELLAVSPERPDGTHWRRCRNGAVPKFAVKGGLSEDGELLFIGRNVDSLVDGRTRYGERFPAQSPPKRLVGKVQPSHGRLYVAFRGSEYFYNDYEVLTLNQSPTSLQLFCRNSILRSCGSSLHVDLLPLPDKLKSLLLSPPQIDDEQIPEDAFPSLLDLVEINAILERNPSDDHDQTSSSSSSSSPSSPSSPRANEDSLDAGWNSQLFPSLPRNLD